jgi:VWFA-related protein
MPQSARLFTAALAVSLLAAQQPATVFRAGTKLVEVTVTVLDKKGNAVTGLDQNDFTVLDEGKPRPVAFFRFDGAPPPPAETSAGPALPAGVFTNRPGLSGVEAPRNITALVLDSLNTAPQEGVLARAQMMRYLRALAPQTRVAIYVMGTQLRVLHDFTADAASLRAKLEKASLGMPAQNVTDFNQSVIEAEEFVNMFPPEMQAIAAEIARNQLEVEALGNAAARRIRLEQSLAAMEALGAHLAGIPGRKSVVWIGGGFSMITLTGNMGMGPHGSYENFDAKVRQTAQRLAQQGVILYIVDSKGLTMPLEQTAASKGALPQRGRGRFESQMDTEAVANDPRPAMQLMADITGGRYFYNTNDLAAGFKQTALDIQASYTLGFYMSDEPDDKWHKLKVRVKRSGISVRNREGYLASRGSTQPVEWTNETWRSVFSNPIGSTAIPLTAKCERTPAGELALTLLADANALQFRPDGAMYKADLEIAIADSAADGKAQTQLTAFTAQVAAADWEAAKQRGVTYRHQWKLAPETISLRIIVHDVRSGQYGALDVPLKNLPR